MLYPKIGQRKLKFYYKTNEIGIVGLISIIIILIIIDIYVKDFFKK